MASREWDTVVGYNFFGGDGSRIHCGQTNDPGRREGEHRRTFGEPDGHLRVATEPMPRWKARQWERANNCSPFGNIRAAAPCAAATADDDWIEPLLVVAGGVLVVGALAALFAR